MVASVWIFRERLQALLPLLQVKHKDWEASFRLDQAEKEVASLQKLAETAETTPTPEEKDKFEQIAELSPNAAILEVRRELEETVRTIAKQVRLPIKHPMSLLGMTRALRSKEIIDQRTSALLDDLRAVGNAAAHGDGETGLSKEDALRYRNLADEAIRNLNAQCDRVMLQMTAFVSGADDPGESRSTAQASVPR